MKKNYVFSIIFQAKFLLMAMSIVITSSAVFGQATTGSLRGTVTDPNGAVVAGAAVTVKNEATGVATVTINTTGDGGFAFSNLLPGTYSVTVRPTSGFKTKTVSGLVVSLGLEREIKVTLDIGAANETVDIVAGSDEVAQVNSQISTNFDSKKVSELPSNAAGSGIDTLALNTPGVTPGFGNVNSNGITLSVNGNRARSNNFTIDGTDNNDLTIGGPSLFISNAEAVQEFQIITNQFSAEYGRNQGAIINISTKSGTNAFHGAAFEYHRNASLLDAMTNIERRSPARSKKDKFISNTFGGVLGGPIVRNKAFFFGSYQGIRQAQNLTSRAGNLAILPSDFARLRAAFPGNAAITALTTQGAFALTNFGTVRPRADRNVDRVCISATLVGPGVTPPNCIVGTNETGLFAAAFPEREFAFPFTQNDITGRVDWSVTSRDNVSVRYLWQKNIQTNSLGGSNGFTGDVPAQSKNLSGFYTRQITSNLVNNFQATTQRLSVLFGGGCTDPLKGCIPDPADIGKAYASVSFAGIAGLTSLATLQTLGGATNLPQGRIVDVYQFSDKMSWIKGSHSMTFGADIRRLHTTAPFLPNLNGVFRYNTSYSLATNRISALPSVNAASSSITLADGNSGLDVKQFDRFFFFQDDWRIRPNLTLNLGIRYEFSGQPINSLYEATVARESNASTALYRQNLPVEARIVPKIGADKNNWAPRVGFAWTPNFGSGSIARFLFGEKDATVLRGGFSMAYDAVFYNIMANISTSAPAVILDTITPLETTPVGMPSDPVGTTVRTALASNLRKNTFDPRLLSQTQVSSDFRSPYSMQYSFGMQRQVNDSNVFEIRYVGNRGRSLFQTVNRNPLYANLYNGFTQTITLGGVTAPISFPSYRNLLGNTPAPQVCVNDTTTPDNEGACAGRLLAGRGLIRSRENTGRSAYDSLQTRYNGRFLDKNLNLGVTYTFSKALDNASEVFAFGESPMAQNPFDLDKGEYGLSGFDRKHSFSMNYIYTLPFHKSQTGFAGKVLGGWQINGTFNLASGRPFTPEQFRNSQVFSNSYLDAGFANTFIGLDSLRPFNGNANVNPLLVGITNIDARLSGLLAPNTPISPTGFYLLNNLRSGGLGIQTPVTPNDVRFIYNGPGAALAFGTPFGTAGRNSVYGPVLNQMNMGVFKTTNLSETVKIQFRAEAFNVLNHPNSGFGVAAGASLPDLILENAGITYGNQQEVALSSRRVQFGIRFIF
jgi:Carboxypeptidase regulatory-like domain